MGLNELKKGPWGYRKDSVYQYITSVEEKFSEKLKEAWEETEKLKEESAAQTWQLKEDLAALKEENRRLKEKQELASERLKQLRAVFQVIVEEMDTMVEKLKLTEEERLSALPEEAAREWGKK